MAFRFVGSLLAVWLVVSAGSAMAQKEDPKLKAALAGIVAGEL